MISDVVIAGAGIGGLTLAIALRRRGVRVRVFERAARTAAPGSGIGLPANGVKGLASLGLETETVRAGAVIGRSVFLDRRGRQLGAALDLSRLRDRIGAPSVALHRARLHAILLGATGPDVIRTGMHVFSYEQQHDAVQVACAHGERVETQLLIGADGLHSSVRSQMEGASDPIYSGYTSWRGVTPANAVAPPGQVSESWGAGERFGIVPIGFGEVYWFATANVPAGGQDRDIRSDLLARFGGWHDPIAGLIDATPADRILRTDIFDRPPIERWHSGRVVLLGDAAHPMTPNMGQGAGQAIEDAVVLDQSLAAHAAVEEALSAYEHRRVARANGIALASRRFGAVAQWSNPVAVWLRDRAIDLIPASTAETQAARLIATDF